MTASYTDYPEVRFDRVNEWIDRAANGDRGPYADRYQPALFSMLDMQQDLHRPDQREHAKQGIHDLFAVHLGQAFEAWRDRLTALDDVVFGEVARTQGRFLAWVLERDHLRPALGDELIDRFEAVLSPGPDIDQIDVSRMNNAVMARFNRKLGDSGVFALLSVELTNAIFAALDHPVSRYSAKDFLESTGSNFGALPKVSLATSAGRAEVIAELERLADAAAQDGLLEVLAVCQVGKAIVKGFDGSVRSEYSGHFEPSIAHCNRCGMRSCRVDVVTVDVLVDFDGTPSVPLFSVHPCMFCGYTERIESPVTFFHPDRGQVVTCVPQGDPHEMAACTQLLVEVNTVYRAHLDPVAQEVYDRSVRIETTSLGDFLNVLQAGHNQEERHVSVLVTFRGSGQGQVVDGTKHIRLALTEDEVLHQRATTPDVAEQQAVDLVVEGVRLTDAGQASAAESLYREALSLWPGCQDARHNLAVLLTMSGRIDEAEALIVDGDNGAET